MAARKTKPRAKARKTGKVVSPAPFKRGMGRPTKWNPDFIRQAQAVAKLAGTDQEVAEVLGISIRTLYKFKAEHDDFSQALSVAKEPADARVVRSLYHRALGYRHTTQKIMQNGGEPIVVEYVEQVPPDTTACIFWLKNRNPNEWRDRHELTGAGGSNLIPAEITIIGVEPKA